MHHKILLLAIILLGFFLRFYQLGAIPRGLYQDETAIGWNAYSILKTGKDEYGEFFPLYFKSFGDYKLPVYIYTTALSVQLFGLSAFAVRLPSAFFGVATLPLFYLLIKKVTKKESLALLSTLLLSINPWHLHYSRATFEVSIVLFFFTLGLLLFHHALDKKRGAFIASCICFIIALYTYNLTRLLSPLLIAGLIFFHGKHIPRREKLAACIVGVFLLLPFTATYVQKGGVTSASGTLITTSAAVKAPILEFRSYFATLPIINKLVFNSLTLTLWQYAHNVANYLSVSFFFLTGSSHGNHGIGTNGQFFLFELPCIVLGLLAVIKKRQKQFLPFFLVGILTILVASLTREAPHATRSFTLLLLLPIMSASGMMYLLEYINRPTRVLFFGVVIFSLFHYVLSYYVRFPVAYAKAWREEDQVVATFVKDNWDSYDNIVIGKDAGLIYSSLLFYLAFPPEEFQKTVSRAPDDSEGMSEVVSFGKIHYADIQKRDMQKGKTLIITSPDKIPTGVTPIAEFRFPERPVVIALKQQLVNYPTQETAYVLFSSQE